MNLQKESAVQDERGMTLIEMIVAVVIAGLVLGPAFMFLVQQEGAFDRGAARMNSLQNYRFAIDQLDAGLRNVGSGVPQTQPYLVYADVDVIAFNADLVTRDPQDPFAVYVDPDATERETGVLRRENRITIPNSSFQYPDSTARMDGLPSPAETIIFYFAPDESTERTDDYVLYRQVNDLEPEVIARNLLRHGNRPFFEYLEDVSTDTLAIGARWVDRSDLPLAHHSPLHLTPGDTGSIARIDDLRAVRVRFTSTSGAGAAGGVSEQGRTIERVIRFPNAGLAVLSTCGDPPQFTSGVSVDTVSTVQQVHVTWSPSVDDGNGQDDLIRYVIYRRSPGQPWGDPYASTTAIGSGYLYVDSGVKADSVYQYAVAAQDCTPAMSQMRASAQIRVPSEPSPTSPGAL